MQQEFDVIVAGAGGSGLAAAYSAAQHGGKVLVLEKRSQPGGTTGIAVGSFTAAGTSLQREANIEDDVLSHAEDAAKFAPPEIEARNNAQLRAHFLRHAAETFQWIRDLGLGFVGPSPEPPNRTPRMHNVVGGAKAYVAALQLALQRAGGTLVCDAAVQSLIREGDRVTGVEVRIDNQLRQFRARRGVVLAAGDYSNNSDLVAEHKGEMFRHIEGVNPYADGDGHILAREAGAELVNMDVAYGPELRFIPSSKKPFQQWLPAAGWRARMAGAVARRLPTWIMQAMVKRLLVTWQHPEDSLLSDGAILVNCDGKRFVDETSSPTREIAVAAQPEKIAHILLDGRLVERYSSWPHFISTAPDIAYAYVADYQRLRSDVTVAGRSLADVAARRGLEPQTLRQTVDEYNLVAEGERSDPFGRKGAKRLGDGGPWVLLGPLKAYFTTTEGGASVNERLQMLDRARQPIPGLYAAGQNGLSGMVLWGHGLHIAWALTSGRLAGQYAMQDR